MRNFTWHTDVFSWVQWFMMGKAYHRWKETRLSRDAHEEVHRLAADVRTLLAKGELDLAREKAYRMHILSQNHALLHVYGHWTCTKVHLAREERRPAARNAYLMLMAPYGTLRRRLRIVESNSGEPDQSTTAFWEP